jgi:hypothetical protein
MPNDRTPADIQALPIETRAEMALESAVEKVVEEHARLGMPLHLWRNGELVEISAEELQRQSRETR